MPKANYFFKCVVIGDIGVGKSNLLRLSEEVLQGLGRERGSPDYRAWQIEHDGQVIEAQVWDTAGTERNRAIMPPTTAARSAALLVYRHPRWRRRLRIGVLLLRELRANADPSIVAMLVGNKCDLRHRKAVDVEDAKDFAEDNNLAFIETSALDATNVEARIRFETILLEIYRIVRKNLEAGKYDGGG